MTYFLLEDRIISQGDKNKRTKKLNINETDMLEKLYIDFNNIINYEKNLSKKNSKRESKSL